MNTANLQFLSILLISDSAEAPVSAGTDYQQVLDGGPQYRTDHELKGVHMNKTRPIFIPGIHADELPGEITWQH